jgi:hypothetical protein
MIFVRINGVQNRGEKVSGISRESHTRKAFGNRKQCRPHSPSPGRAVFSGRFTSDTGTLRTGHQPGKSRGADWEPSGCLNRSTISQNLVYFSCDGLQVGEVGSAPMFSYRRIGTVLPTDRGSLVTRTRRLGFGSPISGTGPWVNHLATKNGVSPYILRPTTDGAPDRVVHSPLLGRRLRRSQLALNFVQRSSSCAHATYLIHLLPEI